MTVENTLSKWGPYPGNGVTTYFPYTNLVFKASDLLVTKKHTPTSAVTLLSLSDYTITVLNDVHGGYVITKVPLPIDYELRIYRKVEILQLTDLRNQGAFHAEMHEDVFDLLTMITQQLQEEINRALKFPPDIDLVDVPVEYPTSNGFLGWNNIAPWRVESKAFLPANSVVASNNLPSYVSGASYPGTSLEFSRSDHVHGGASFNVLQYGADPTGVTDSDAAFVAAIAAAHASGANMPAVFIPRGNYSLAGQINIAGIRIIGESMFGTIIYQKASAVAVNGVFRADGLASISTTTSVDVVKGDREITLTDASLYSIGDLIEIRVTGSVLQSDATLNQHTLITRIMDKVGSVLTLLDPVPFAIGASDSEVIVKLTPVSTVVSNLTMNGVFNTGQAPFGNNAIVVFYSENVEFSDLNLVNYPNGYGVFLWSSYGSYAYNIYAQNVGDQVSFGSSFGTFDCSSSRFEDITALWPARDGMVFNRNSYCQYSNLYSVRAQVRSVKFHGCKQCSAVNITGNNSQGGTGLTISGGTSDSVFSNILTTGNKGPNAVGNQVGVWLNDCENTNNVLTNINSWDNGDWDLTVFATDTGNVINGGRFSSAVKLLNQNSTPMLNVMLDDVLSGGLTSLSMVNTTSAGPVGPSHRLHRHFPNPPAIGELMGEYTFAGNNDTNALVEYAKMYSANVDWRVGHEAAKIHFQGFTGGVNSEEATIGNGVALGNLVGQGIGTLNADAVYDNGVLLTCYVLEHARQQFSGEIKHDRALSFNPDLLDIKAFIAFWEKFGHLPSLPSKEDWKNAKFSVGDIVQRLWETVELQAVHIKQLLSKIEDK